MGFNRRFVVRVAANVEQTAMNFGVQRLHAAIEHFGKARVLADVFDSEAGVAQRLGRATGGNDFNSSLHKDLDEGNKAGFVGNGNEGALNFCHCVTKSPKPALAVNVKCSGCKSLRPPAITF